MGLRMMRTGALPLLAAAMLLAGTAEGAAPEGTKAHEAAEEAARTVPGAPRKGVKSCHEDIERFCAKVQPGEGRIGRCLKAHRAELSKSCRRFLWHGGKAHVEKAFLEVDSYVLGTSTPPARAPK